MLLLASCSKTPPVEAVQANIDAIQLAIEEKNTGAIMQHVLDTFRGNESLDKSNLRKLLAVHFIRHKNINVVITRMDVNHDPKFPFHASMEGVVALTGAENILPQDGRLFKVSGKWQLHDGDWLLDSLNWE